MRLVTLLVRQRQLRQLRRLSRYESLIVSTPDDNADVLCPRSSSASSSSARYMNRRSVRYICITSSSVIASIFAGQLLLANSQSQRELLADSGEDTTSWLSKPLSLIRPGNNDNATKRGTGGDRASQKLASPENVQSSELADSSTAAQSSSDFLSKLGHQITTYDYSLIGDMISDAIIPSWVRTLPGYLRKLQAEMEMSPGSVAHEIWQEAFDVEMNPETMWNAQVRISRDLCDEEHEFLRKRKFFTRTALARYLEVPEEDIDAEDIPVIAMCGSGAVSYTHLTLPTKRIV